MQVTAADPTSVDAAVLALTHGKLLLRGARRTGVVSLAGPEATPQLVQAADEVATAFDLLMNLRAVGAPQAIEEAYNAAFGAWVSEGQVSILDRSGQAFAPARPVPTHRIG